MAHDHDDDSQTKTDVAGTGKGIVFDPKAKAPPCLVLLSGPELYIGRQWPVTQTAMVLGRAKQSEIFLEVPSLSKAHAKFEVDGDQVTLTDLGATNRTIVNGVKLEPSKPYPLKDNDQVRAGELVFKFLQKGLLIETAERARMQSELEVARNVQSSLFPKVQDVVYGRVKIGGRYRTATECGGDWWWHWSHNGKAFALIADATGHGAGAALLTSAARSAVATIEDDDAADIGMVYSQLSKALYKCADGALTMSAFLIEIDLKTLDVKFINASHPNAIKLALNDKNLSWNGLETLRTEISNVLGGLDRSFTIGQFKAVPGTRLMLPTDGLMERWNSANQPLTERQFYNSLIAAHIEQGADQAGFLDALLVKSDEMVNFTVQADDITVVAVDFL